MELVGLREPEGVAVVELVTEGVSEAEALLDGEIVTVLEAVPEGEPDGDDEDAGEPEPVTEPERVPRGLLDEEGLLLSEAVPEEDGEPEALPEGDGEDVPLSEPVRDALTEREEVKLAVPDIVSVPEGVPLLTVMRRVVFGSAVPVKVGVVSLVKPPEVMEPVTGVTLSVTLVITGAAGIAESMIH